MIKGCLKEITVVSFLFKIDNFPRKKNDFISQVHPTPKSIIILTDSKAVTGLFQKKIIPPPLLIACDYAIQFNFAIAHNPCKNNTAADYLSRLKSDPKDKLILKMREDVETKPVEVSVQSAGISKEEQIFFTEDDNETEQEMWKRKKQARENLAVKETAKTKKQVSQHCGN